MAKENIYLASKPRYEILDGLRGVAYALFKAFDEPTRKWLTEHWLKRRRS